MADTLFDTRPKTRLTLVQQVMADLPEPEDQQEQRRYQATEKILTKYAPSIIKKARPGILAEGERQALIKLGAQRIEDASQIAAIRADYEERLAHTRKLWGRGAAWQAMTLGLICTLLAFAGGLWTGGRLTSDGFAMRVASERVPRSAVPTLDYTDEPVQYDRGLREPGNAE